MKTKLLTTSALVLGAFCSPVFAQDTAEPEAGDSRTLQTVRITATKREQTLQDVPVAVSVVDESVIKNAEILDLADLQSIVPSLRFDQLQNSANSTFVIRGFGNGANNIGIEPSVGVFVDGVYRSRTQAALADLPNLERVEVLRGPQSTLFGKNASAGVVSVVTAAPSLDGFTGSIEGGISNFNGYRGKAYVSVPLSDTVAVAVGGSYNKRDGFAENLENGEDTNGRDRWSIRGDLLWEPNENASFRLIADYDEIDENCCIATNLVDSPPISATIRAIGGDIVLEDPFSYEVFYNGSPNNKIENSGISFTGEYDFEGFTLTSITAQRNSERNNNYDVDFTSADLARLTEQVELETFTQEVRLTSNGDGNFDWLVGAYYFDESAEQNNVFPYGDDFRNYVDILAGGGVPGTLAAVEGLLSIPTGTLAGAGQGTTEFFSQDDTAWSLFGSLDFHLTDRLTATLGVNYTENEKDVVVDITSTDVLSALDLTQIGYDLAAADFLINQGVNIADPVAIGTYFADPTNLNTYLAVQPTLLGIASNFDTADGPLANPLAAFQPLQFLPPFLSVPNAVESGSTSVDELTYNFRLAYDLTDNINVYASYGTGFKSNAWNLSRDSRPTLDDYTATFDAVNQVSISAVTDPFTGQQLRDAPSSPIQDAGLAVTNLTTGSRFADPEEAEVFELGLKGAWNTFALNLAIFDQTIENFQANPFIGTGFVLLNAEEQSVTGLEVDATWSPVEPLTLTFAGTFLDATYDTFTQSSVGDISGTTPSGVPDMALSVGGLYNFDLTNTWGGFVRADWQHESDRDFFDGGDLDPQNAILDAAGITREVNTFNASLGFTNDNGLGVTFWGRNIFDDEYITTAFPGVAQEGIISGYPVEPATYGVTVRKEW